MCFYISVFQFAKQSGYPGSFISQALSKYLGLKESTTSETCTHYLFAGGLSFPSRLKILFILISSSIKLLKKTATFKSQYMGQCHNIPCNFVEEGIIYSLILQPFSSHEPLLVTYIVTTHLQALGQQTQMGGRWAGCMKPILGRQRKQAHL